MRKRQLIVAGGSLALLLVAMGAGCMSEPPVTPEESIETVPTVESMDGDDAMMKDEDENMEMESMSDMHAEEESAMDGSASMDAKDVMDITGDMVDQPVKTFDMTARRWEFSPSNIVVNEGDRVVLNITSEDVTHGFTLSAFDVREQLDPGKTTRVEFVADKAGTYSFFCSVYCGSGHSQMRGTLTVK